MRKIKLFLSIFIFSAITPNFFAQTVITVQDTIWENTIWDADTVKVMNDIVVVDSASLTILSGTYVEFQGLYYMTVNGFFQALGAESDSITFTVKDTTGFHNQYNNEGAWVGILFNTNPEIWDDTIRIQYCIFEYTKDVSISYIGYFTITSRQANDFYISDCRFSNNYKGSGGSIGSAIGIRRARVENCTFRNNIVASIIHNAALVKYCEIHSNVGAAVSNWNCDYTAKIICNHIHNNHNPDWSDGGVIQLSWTDYAEVIGNLIHNNSADEEGGGIFSEGSYAIIANNTICNNRARVGGAIYCTTSSPEILSNIIYNNSATQEGNQIALYGQSDPTIQSCILQGGLNSVHVVDGAEYNGEYENNLDLDPQFMEPDLSIGPGSYTAISDWSLRTISPAINAGMVSIPDIPLTDLGGIPRVSYRKIDIGAMEYHVESIECGDEGEPLLSYVTDTQRWIADTIKVNGDINIEEDAVLTIGPGTYVEFQYRNEIGVNGRLIIEGFPDKKTVLAAKDPSIGWRGIINDYNIVDDTIIIRNAHIRDVNDSEGALRISGHQYLIIENTDFSNCDDCIKIESTDSEMSSCRFYENTYNEMISIERANVSMRNCSVFNNKRGENAFFLLEFQTCNAELISTAIYNNEGPGANFFGDAGFILYHSGHEFLMENCLVTNNTDSASRPFNIEPIVSAKIINTTFTNNVHKGASHSLYIESGFNSSVAGICNSIIYGNRFGTGTKRGQVYLAGNYESMVLNSVIEGGVDSIRLGPTETGFEFENIFDIDPTFNSASPEPGIFSSGGPFDYSLTNFSPLINKGRSDFPYLPVTDYDLAGNPRIYHDEVDIGAYENQAGIPQISVHPSNLFLCEGEKAELSVETNDTAIFWWFKDGEVIPDASTGTFVIDSVTELDEGNYLCEMENGFGKVLSNQAYLLVKQPPRILTKPTNQWVTPGENVLLKAIISGSEPLTYEWFHDGEIIPGVYAPEHNVTLTDSDQEGEYHFGISNSCGSTETEPVNIFLAPELCMVTVDPSTGNNLVIWEKSSVAPIEKYNIYRESQAAGIYDILGTVDHDDLSILVDETADPTVQAYLYKITGVDTSGYETDIDLCEPHKTIHLLVSTNPELNTTQLEWDRYYGFTYSTYNILRSATGSGFLAVHFLASSLASWTDPEPLPETGFYRISVDKPVPCFPAGAGKKADAGPYSHSLSNVENNRLQAGESPPDTIIITKDNLDENNMYGTLVGRLQTIDADTLDAHLYTLVSGEGDEDNFSFTILGDMLLAAELFDYEVKDVYSIRVRCTDKGNLSREEVFTVFVNDVLETNIRESAIQKPRIYPNPFSQSAIIKFPNPGKAKYRMYITDLSGKVVRFIDNIMTDKLEIYRDKLPSGMYMIELIGPEIYRDRIIIE